MMWLAGTPDPSPVWQTWLPTLLGILITAAGGVAGTVWVKRLSRRVDEATASKTESESRKADAETVSIEVSTARGLITDIKSMMSDQRTNYESQIDMLRGQSEAQIQSVRVQHQADMGALTRRLTGLESRQQSLRSAFVQHGEWDRQATDVLKQVDPDFPAPPPVNFD
ncbi:hypothetical protein ACWKSP_26615 [Micromonosporaceae bacterium Da 78-11]